MKKLICVLLAVILCTAAAGCTATKEKRPAQGQSGGKTVDDILSERINESGKTEEAEADQTEKETAASLPADKTSVDVDLTELSSTMVYSEVYNMMTSPDDYLGKRVRMNGSFAYAQGDNRYYFACIISDATACCSQGIEFVLSDERKFPEQYPEKGTNITVSGIFDTYYEGSNRYCQLIDAVME